MSYTFFSKLTGAFFLGSAMSLSASQFALNFGPGDAGQADEVGYDKVAVAIIDAGETGLSSDQALGTFDGVNVSVRKDGTNGRLRTIDRADAYTPADGSLANLCDSWIGTEEAPDGMVIVMSGLDTGVFYRWQSYHIDENNQNATMEVSASTDGGSNFTVIGSHMIKASVYDNPITNPNPFIFDFEALPGQDVHVKFVTTSNGNSGAEGDFTLINGMDLGISPDTDGDGMDDQFEQAIIDADENDAINSIADVLPGDDFDSDDSTNLAEFELGTNPLLFDTDEDGYRDGYENNNGSWTDETNTGTDPLNNDTDGDGLLDGVENPDLIYSPNNPSTQPGTDPNQLDTDGDAESDGDEVLVHLTDPTDPGDVIDNFPNSTAKFDMDQTAQPQFGWTSAPSGNGDNGTVSITTTTLGSAEILTRDRNGASTDGPDGHFLKNDLWRDFIFANPSGVNDPENGLQVEVSGLTPDSLYEVTVFAYDSASARSRRADWSDITLGEVATSSFAGGAANDPTGFGDYNIRFRTRANATGVATFQGVVAASGAETTGPNVFVNAIVIGAADPDLDADGLSDAYEQTIIDFDPNDSTTSLTDIDGPLSASITSDFDQDGSTDFDELGIGTDPTDNDTDDDGALDGQETNTGIYVSTDDRGTDPFVNDTDGDGLLDGVEDPDSGYDPLNPSANTGSNPNEVDSDGDRVDDGQEITDGTDPTSDASFLQTYPNAIAKFDLGVDETRPQFDWTAAPLGNGTDGAVSITTTAVGNVNIDSRDRGEGATDDPGADSANNDLWNDFVFADGSFASRPNSGLRIDIAGLQPLTSYPVTVAAYDPGSGGAPRGADWSQVGGSEPSAKLSFTAPDPTEITDYTVTIMIETDENGAASIQGLVTSDSPSGSHNVFLNYLVIGESTDSPNFIQITGVTFDPGSDEFTVEFITNMAGPFTTAFGTSLNDGFPILGQEVTTSPAVIAVPAALVDEPKVFLRLE